MWELQTILVPRLYPLRQVLAALHEAGYVTKKVDCAPRYYRIRQIDPIPHSKYFSRTASDGVIYVFMASD
jgi:hypothetical protein